MPDPIITTSAVTLFGAAAARRVFGESADELSHAFARVTEHRLRNLGRIAEKADAKVASDDVEVSLRVAAKVLEGGSWCDDEVMQEYLAGVLAGARGGVPANDRGAYWADLVARLSSEQIRVHFLIYRALREHGSPEGTSVQLLEGQLARSIYLPFRGIADSLGLSWEQANDLGGICLPILAKEALIGGHWGAGGPGLLRFPGAAEAGLHVFPTHAGMDLFLWAHGRPATHLEVILDPNYVLPPFAEEIPPVAGARVGPGHQ